MAVKKKEEKVDGLDFFIGKKVKMRFVRGKGYEEATHILLAIDRGYMVVEREDGVVAAYSQTPHTRIKLA